MQINCKSSDFKHKFEKQPLWLDNWNNTQSVDEDPRRTSLKLRDEKQPVWLDNWNNTQSVDEEPRRTSLKLKDEERFHQDAVTTLRLLKTCKGLVKGLELHAHIRQHKYLEENCYVASALVSMYARYGAVAKAQHVIEGLPIHVRDVTTWTALISAYAQQGQGEEALKCFDRMQHEGHSPDAVTFTCALKACGIIGAIGMGEQIHDKLVNLGMLESYIILASALVDMYARCGALPKAQQVFDDLSVRDVVTWNTLIAGYVQQGHGKEALRCFDSMQREGHFPDGVTFVSALKACGIIRAVTKGEQIHDMIVTLGMLERNIAIRSSLMDMYAKCGVLLNAQQVFDELLVPMRDVVMWNTLIAGYMQQGQCEEALKCFDNMQREGHSPDAVTLTCGMQACGSIRAVTRGEQTHGKVVNLGMLMKDAMLQSSLVDMYARFGTLSRAQQVFEELHERDVVTWNALIGGYVQHGQGAEALVCFENMQHEGHFPNVITYSCALKACGIIGAIAKGERIHGIIVNLGTLEEDIVLGSTLVGMYARCGALSKALKLFNELPFQNVVIWTELIAGYAQHGQGEEALHCFARMQANGGRPTPATLVCVLNACSHSGLLDQAGMHFSRMITKHNITPDVEHYSCMVDLFGRAGKLDNALEIERRLSADYVSVWLALLGACCKWGEMNTGSLAFEHALCLGNEDPIPYVCIANLHKASANKST